MEQFGQKQEASSGPGFCDTGAPDWV